ncbi:centrosomal protein of 112 kDa-like [Physella acuta]|uniref:centrosomal protein of 112 kDa-like n=1 Tax=Physella acuta TaxID=109671 RepID=UPI0027DB71EC|nr:centrosomal protein of 112 kDa-like [Physella acuta]
MESSTEPNIATQTVENRKLMLRLIALEDKASSSFCKIEKKMKKLKTNLQKVTGTVEDLLKQGELGTKQLTENMEQQFLIVKTHFREVVAYHSALESEVQHLKTMPPAVNIRYNESDNSDKIDEISKKLSDLEVENSSLRLRIDELSEQLQEQLKSAGGFTEQEFFIQEFEHFKSKMEKLQRNKEKMNEKIKSCDGKIRKLTMNQNKFMKEMQENLCTRKKQSLDSSRLTLDVKEELEKRIVSLEDEKTKVRMLMKKTEEVNQKVDSIYANGLSTSNENSKNLEQDTLQKQMKELDKKVVELQLDFLKGKYVWSKVKLDEESIPTSADVFSAITDVSVKYEIMLAMLVKWLSQQEELKDFKANLNKQVNFLRIKVAKLKGSGSLAFKDKIEKTTNKQPTKSSCGNQPTTMTHSTLPPSHGHRHSSASPAPGDSISTTRGVAGPTSSHPGADPSQEVNSQTAPASSSTVT